MNDKSNNFILLIITGILAAGILAMTLCSLQYGTSHAGFDYLLDIKCSFTAHSFVQTAAELSGFGVIPLLGILLFKGRFIIPAGFIVTIFKPPRLSQFG